MQAKQIRVIAELVMVIVIIVFAWIALKPARVTDEHYILDHGKIVYDGQVFKDKFNGQGSLKLKNGDKYRGHFKDGRFDGQGTFKSNKGWQFKGHFSKGQVTGQGKLTTKNDKIYQGVFANGNFKQTKKIQD